MDKSMVIMRARSGAAPGIIARHMHQVTKGRDRKILCCYICDFMLLNVASASLLDGCRAWTNLWQSCVHVRERKRIVKDFCYYICDFMLLSFCIVARWVPRINICDFMLLDVVFLHRC